MNKGSVHCPSHCMLGAFSLLMCVFMWTRVSRGGCVSVCACESVWVSLYPCLSGDITPEVSDAPGASNKREENCSGYMWPDSFTCVHTHAYKRKQRWADREACSNHTAWILLYVLATCWYLFKELHSCALCHCVHTCVQCCFGFGLRHQLRWC